MRGHGERVANTGDGAKGVGPRPQVSDLAQILHRVSLFCEGIFVWLFDPAENVYPLRAYFDGLLLAGGRAEFAFDSDTAARDESLHLGCVVRERAVSHDLDARQARAVVHLDEREPALRVPACPDPSVDDGGRAEIAPGKEMLDSFFSSDDLH